MRIKTKSLHRTFNNWAWGGLLCSIDRNLCNYLWATIFAMVFSPVILLGKTIECICNHWPKVNINVKFPRMSYDTKKRVEELILHTFLGLATIGYGLLVIYLGIDVLVWTGIVIAVIGSLIGLVLLIGTLHDKWRETHPRKSKPRKDRTPNMTWEWIKAKKKKNCPLLEWE